MINCESGVRKQSAMEEVTRVPMAILQGNSHFGSQSGAHNGGMIAPFKVAGCRSAQRSLCSPLSKATARKPADIAHKLPVSLPRRLVSRPTKKTPRSEP